MYRRFRPARSSIALILVLTGCNILNDWDMIFLRPWPEGEMTPTDLGLGFDEVWLSTSNGNKIQAWFLPAQGGEARATFLIHPGLEGNLERYLPVLPWGASNEFNVFIYDYQGFGGSEGEVDFRNFEPDTNAAVSYVLSRPEPSTQRVIHFGVSLGTLNAIAAAADHPDTTIGLIVYGAFFPDEIAGIWLATQVCPLLKPLGDIGSAIWTLLITPYMNPRNFIDDVQAPAVSVIPADDTIIPPEAQRSIYEALPEPKELIMTFGDHSHAHEDDPNLGPAILEWARRLPGLLSLEE